MGRHPADSLGKAGGTIKVYCIQILLNMQSFRLAGNPKRGQTIDIILIRDNILQGSRAGQEIASLSEKTLRK